MRSDLRNARSDLLAGVVFVVFGLGFAAVSTTYEIGTPLRMGPGYFPLAVGGLLVVFGAAIVVKGFVAPEEPPAASIPWRALVLLAVAVVFFGVTVRGLGVAPATFVTVLLAAFAARRMGIVRAVLIATGLAALSILIFVVALQLRLPLLGPWIPL